MSFNYLILTVLPFLTPTEALAGQLRSAIWNDLQVNAMIGNGNWVASLWYNAGSDEAKVPDLHLNQLVCRGNEARQVCSFTLFRDGGPKEMMDETAPDNLSCRAFLRFTKEDEGWSVVHKLPRRSEGHSRTTMKCKPSERMQ